MSISILQLIAIILFTVGWIVAITTGGVLNPLFLVVSAFAVLSVFAGIIP